MSSINLDLASSLSTIAATTSTSAPTPSVSPSSTSSTSSKTDSDDWRKTAKDHVKPPAPVAGAEAAVAPQIVAENGQTQPPVTANLPVDVATNVSVGHAGV